MTTTFHSLMDAMVAAVAWGEGYYYTMHVMEVEDMVGIRRG
jgi:hypothetical protein